MNRIYQDYIKRLLDIICALFALILFSWLYLIIAILVKIKLGSPILFVQVRPGIVDPKTGKEKLFKLYKFRSMTDERDEEGDLRPDDARLTKFGELLRATSLDEIPEAINILKGDMSVIGPRPQLVRDMVFMTKEQRKRHSVKPGLSGLAQINGRNCILWEDKMNYDLEYIKNISFINDLKITLTTIIKVFKTESISFDGMATAEDLGDYLLRTNKITKKEYSDKQKEAKDLLNEFNK